MADSSRLSIGTLADKVLVSRHDPNSDLVCVRFSGASGELLCHPSNLSQGRLFQVIKQCMTLFDAARSSSPPQPIAEKLRGSARKVIAFPLLNGLQGDDRSVA